VSADPIYRLAGPTALCGPPEAFSYSSLAAVERCPRQWQLTHSRYGDRDRFPARPSPDAAEGEIVHEVLAHLFRRLSFFGLPAQGTDGFRAAVADADPRGLTDRLVGDHEARIRAHPRGAGARLKPPAEQLLNRAIRLFRDLYPAAAATGRVPFAARGPVPRPGGGLPLGRALADLVECRGALGEVPLAHPGLGFRGVLDLVWWDAGPVVADFKTGGARPEHATQVGYYAVLWWRVTGVPPVRTEVRYPGAVAAEAVTPERLAMTESDLRSRVRAAAGAVPDAPAAASPGEHCRWCDVRQFCTDYWAPAAAVTSPADVEVVVEGEPTGTGFTAATPAGDTPSVVYAPDVGRALGPFRPGDRLRILNAWTTDGVDVVEIRPWSEVFRVPGA
jgi:hypothetical protein